MEMRSSCACVQLAVTELAEDWIVPLLLSAWDNSFYAVWAWYKDFWKSFLLKIVSVLIFGGN